MRTIILVLLFILFMGVAGAVTISNTPTYSFGPEMGFYNPGTIQAQDLYATDDLLVDDDAAVSGDLTVTGAASIGGGTINGGVYSGNLKLPSTYTLRVIGGTIVGGSSITGASLVSNTTITGTNVRGTTASIAGQSIVGGTLSVAGATTLAGTTINTSSTLAVTTADKLTVGGVIVPQAITIPVPLDADVTANGTVFIPISGNYEVIGVSEAHSVAATPLPKPGLTLVKCTGTQAPATAGTVIMSNKIDLGGTPSTIQTGTLHINAGTCKVNTTERLGIRLDNPVTSLSGGCLSISLKRI